MKPMRPLAPQPPEVSVSTPINQALARVQEVLFHPFHLGKWFVIGFCGWLALLGEGGGHGFNAGGGHHRDGSFQHEYHQAKDYVLNNLYWIVPVAVAVVLLIAGLWILFTWLSSRGKFMFLHCVALNKAEVVVPWGEYGPQANSLFWFRIVLSLIGSVLVLPLAAFLVVIIVQMVNAGHVWAGGIAMGAAAAFILLVLAVALALIGKLTADFVVPIMYLRRIRCLAAWSELRGLLAANFGRFILYLLVYFILSVAVDTMVFILMLLTCCFCCLLLVPYVRTVILLPVIMFKRCYAWYYLAQYGPDYDVFPAPPPPVASPATGLAPAA